jgi:hypothetical protein
MLASFINELGETGGTIIAGIAVIATSIGWWMRRERVESAKAHKSVTADNIQSNTYEEQAKEIKAVRERLSTMEAAYVAQSVQITELLKKLSEMEARMVGITAHHENLILCELCTVKNYRVLEALNKTLSVNSGEE